MTPLLIWSMSRSCTETPVGNYLSLRISDWAGATVVALMYVYTSTRDQDVEVANLPRELHADLPMEVVRASLSTASPEVP